MIYCQSKILQAVQFLNTASLDEMMTLWGQPFIDLVTGTANDLAIKSIFFLDGKMVGKGDWVFQTRGQLPIFSVFCDEAFRHHFDQVSNDPN